MVGFIISQWDDKIASEYIVPYLNNYGIKSCITRDDDKNKPESIFIKYNAGIERWVEDGLKPDDVIVFCHEDIKLIDPEFVKKMSMIFEQKPDVGLVGVAGSSRLHNHGMWWAKENGPEDSIYLRGHVYQEYNEGTSAEHMIKGAIGFFDDLVVVDGLCFAIRGSLLIDGLRFDEKSFDGFDFYDLDICFQVLERGFKICCADILVQHRSVGDIRKKPNWFKNRDIFISKWENKGIKFPVTSNSIFKKENIEIVEV